MMPPCYGAPVEIADARTVSWNGSATREKGPSVLGWLEDVPRGSGAFEWVTFAYIAWLNSIVIVFHRNIAHPARYLTIHVAMALGIAWLSRAAARSPHRALRFARHWYPLPLYIFFFEELEGLVHVIFPGWFDGWLISFDYNLVGVYPSVWLARFAGPVVNDFMQFAYMTYFLYLVILPAILYSQRERLAYWTVMVSTAVAHYSVYVIAVLLPIESPYHALVSFREKPLTGGPFTATIDVIERFARVHGAAFPSAHVAGSMVAILASWRYRRWLFWTCLPFFLSMCIATVYGRYHYIADVLAGIAVGTAGFFAGDSLMQRKGALPPIAG
jgi:membrane-associated phospholipid phosphatase